jgi:hypothetical protein
MNEIIAFIIIWGIISLLSQLSKKSKRQAAKQTPVPGTPPKQKTEQEIPHFLRDLLGLPKEEKTVPSSTMQVPEEKMVLEPEEEVYEERVRIPAVEISAETTEEDKYLAPEPEIKREKIEMEITPLEMAEKSDQVQIQNIREMGKLKQALIWKEILDKPVSLRGRDFFKNPFIKF